MNSLEDIVNRKNYSLKKNAILKLVYLLTVLPNPSQDIISKIKSLCFKIARKRIIQDDDESMVV